MLGCFQLQIVPGKGNSCINVGFAPFPTTEVTSVKDCLGYALGYASLEDKVAHCEGKVDRKQQYDVAPLQLDMTAQVKPALYVAPNIPHVFFSTHVKRSLVIYSIW